MLDVSNINKTFNAGTINENHAIKDLSMHFDKGDYVAVIGGNGAGKSTMLNLISGGLCVDSGKITLDNQDITKMPEHKRAKYIGRVFQDPMMGTAADMLIEENMAMAYRRGKKRTFGWYTSAKEREMFCEMLLKLGLGLEDRLNAKIGLLSGGQRQAVTLLMATMNEPKLLLLDEHTAALDPKTAAKVMELSNEIITEKHLTTLMVTHNMKDAITYGNRLIMMNKGQIVLDIRGEEKQKLTVNELVERFSTVSGDEVVDEKLLLS